MQSPSLTPQLRGKLCLQEQPQVLAEELLNAGSHSTFTRPRSERLQTMAARSAHGLGKLIGSPLALSTDNAGDDLRRGSGGHYAFHRRGRKTKSNGADRADGSTQSDR